MQITSPIERRIVWLCKAGLASKEGIIWLKSKQSKLKADHGEISIYLFLGTCDFTCKMGDFITLKENLSDKYDRLIDNFYLLSEYAKRKHVEVTFFELPYYSITEWNWHKGDPMPQVFKNDDHTLCAIVKRSKHHHQRNQPRKRQTLTSFQLRPGKKPQRNMAK